MRRILILTSLLVLGTFYCQAQVSEASTEKKVGNELKLNFVYPLVEILELNYEINLDEDFSIGFAANYWFDDEAAIEYQFIPSFRFYPISPKPAAGFFVEANFSYLSVKEEFELSTGTDNPDPDFVPGFGMGVATGYKFLSKRNFVSELYIGAGKVFGDFDDQFYPRIGITLGKRF